MTLLFVFFTVHDTEICFRLSYPDPERKGKEGGGGGEGKVEGRREGGGGCPALLVRGYGRKIRQKINTVLIFIFWGILQWPLFVSTYVSYIHF